VLPTFDLSTARLGEPLYIWLLAVPAALLILWMLQALRRRRDILHMQQRRLLPVRERFPRFGSLPAWLCLILALAFTILALARPRMTVALLRTKGVDLVILQDASASMYVRDVKPDRWQRSMRFLRVVAESLQWNGDRIALALFAHISAPQVRLTRDPNTFYFFLDHLKRESPFPLADDTTWDTNIELGIYWGMRLVEKDEQLHGRSANSPAFVLVTDGQVWSGEIQRSLQLARARGIPVFVVGVGTSYGGYIPESTDPDGSSRARPGGETSRVHSILDRRSLLDIASAGGGQYFDLDRDSDRVIASTVIDAARRRGGPGKVEEQLSELYWHCLAAAAWFVALSAVWWRQPGELWLQALGTSVGLAFLWRAVL
jgi:Ca-activated chloride channel homolog